MVCFLQALVLRQGVGGQPFVWVYCLFCSYDHLTAPGGGVPIATCVVIPCCDILVKSFDLGFPVKRDGYRSLLGMSYFSFFEVDMSWFGWYYWKQGGTIICCVTKLIKKVLFEFEDIFRSSRMW